MNRTVFLTAGIAAGFLLLAPGMALAETAPTEHAGNPKAFVHVLPAAAHAGGTDGPVADQTPVSNPAPAVAMGALALGGIGMAAAQRRRSRRQRG
jgi:hypothetical protein